MTSDEEGGGETTDTIPYEGREGEGELTKEPSATTELPNDPFSQEAFMFSQFMKFTKEQCKTIEVNPRHEHSDKRNVIKDRKRKHSSSKGNNKSSSTSTITSKGRSYDLDPLTPHAGTRSNDAIVQTAQKSYPRTNVNGDLRHNSIGNKKSKQNTDFSISESSKKQKLMENSESAIDGVSIPTQSDMDQKINDLIESSSSESEKSDSSDSDFDFDELKQGYLDDDEIGPPIHSKIASLFSSLKPQGMAKEKVLEMAKVHPMPKNCNLEVRNVNPEIWSEIMSAKDRSQDLALQKAQKLNTKASYAILRIADSALTARKSKDKDLRSKALKQIIKYSSDALAFTTTVNAHTEKLRRELIVHKMAQEQRSITKDIDPNHTLLFGDNLTKKLQEVAGARLKLKKPKFNDWNSYQVGDDPKNRFWSRKNPRDRKNHGSKRRQRKKYKKSTKDSSKKSD